MEMENELVKIPKEKQVLRERHGASPGCGQNKPGGQSGCFNWWDKPGRHLSCSFFSVKGLAIGLSGQKLYKITH